MRFAACARLWTHCKGSETDRMFESLPYRHHRGMSREKRRLIAMVGAVALVILLFTLADFARRAMSMSDCFDEKEASRAGTAVQSDALQQTGCGQAIAARNEHLQVDLLAVLATVGTALYTGLTLSRARRRTKVAVLAAVFVVLLLAGTYSLLWYLTPPQNNKGTGLVDMPSQ